MNTYKHILDTNKNLLVERYKNGVQLVNPVTQHESAKNSINSIYDLPLAAYFMDDSCHNVDLNEKFDKSSVKASADVNSIDTGVGKRDVTLTLESLTRPREQVPVPERVPERLLKLRGSVGDGAHRRPALGTGGRGRTGTGLSALGILSPVRLPISPLRHHRE